MYIAYLARSFSYVSIVNYVSAVSMLHKWLGYDVEFMSDFAVKSTLSGYKRILGDFQHQKLPITVDMLLAIVQKCDHVPDSGFISAMLCGFYTFLRKANLVPKSPNTFIPGTHLCRDSFQFTQFGVLLKVTGTKTIQYGERVLYLPMVYNKCSSICPVRALKHHFDKFTCQGQSPAFLYQYNGKMLPITQSVLSRWLKSKLKSIGVNPKDYTLHSLRRGGASRALLNGADVTAIAAMGDWKSLAVLKYLDQSVKVKLNVAYKL